MSIETTHVAFEHRGITLNDLETHTLARRLPQPYPFAAAWAVKLLGNITDDYMTCFGYGKDVPFDGVLYYTAATIPSAAHGGAPPMKWSCGANGFDNLGDYCEFGRWYYQGYRTYRTTTDTIHEFYYDLPDLTKVCTGTVAGTSYFSTPGTTHMFRWMDVPWAELEMLDGRMQGIKMWNSYFTPMELAREAGSPWPQLPKHYGALWDIIPLRTKEDRRQTGWKVKNARRWEYPDPALEPTTSGDQPDRWRRNGMPKWQWSTDAGLFLPAAAGGATVQAIPTMRVPNILFA